MQRAWAAPNKVRLLFLDEMTFYRRPALGREWHERQEGGRGQPTVAQSPGSNSKRRISAPWMHTTAG